MTKQTQRECIHQIFRSAWASAILAILNLHVVLMPPAKLRFNLTYGSGDVLKNGTIKAILNLLVPRMTAKSASEIVVCFSRLLHIITNFIDICKYRSKK